MQTGDWITSDKSSKNSAQLKKPATWQHYRRQILTIKISSRSDEALKSFDFLIPTAIFQETILSFSECLVEYLRETYGLNYHQIAILLRRNEKNILTLYSRATSKRLLSADSSIKKISSSQSLPQSPVQSSTQFSNQNPDVFSNAFFPLSIIANYEPYGLGPLEAVALFLKSKGLQNHQIAVLLGRSQKTIWTTLDRASKKLAASKKHPASSPSGGGLNE